MCLCVCVCADKIEYIENPNPPVLKAHPCGDRRRRGREYHQAEAAIRDGSSGTIVYPHDRCPSGSSYALGSGHFVPVQGLFLFFLFHLLIMIKSILISSTGHRELLRRQPPIVFNKERGSRMVVQEPNAGEHRHHGPCLFLRRKGRCVGRWGEAGEASDEVRLKRHQVEGKQKIKD